MGKQAAPKASSPSFKTLGMALSALGRGDLPKGTKLVIGATQTVLTKNTKNTRQVFFTFVGTPAQFAKLCLKTASYDVKVEIEEAASTSVKSGDDE